MKTTSTLKEFSALSFDPAQVTHATAPAIPESPPRLTPESVQGFQVPLDSSDESFRELLHLRSTAPFSCQSPYHRGGTNE